MRIDMHPTTEPAAKSDAEAESEALYAGLAVVDLWPLRTIEKQLLARVGST